LLSQSPLGSKILPALINQYKNIDTRGIFARTKGQDWYCIFLKIYLTSDSKSTIDDIHKHKISLLSTNDEDIRFLVECTDISDIYGMCSQISNKGITIQNETAKLHPNSQNIFDSNTVVYKAKDIIKEYITPTQSTQYEHVFLPIDGDETPYAALDRYGFTTKEFKYRNLYEDFKVFLDMNEVVINRNLIIIFPIYWKWLKLNLDEQMTYITKFEMHKSLSEHAKNIVKLKKSETDWKLITNIQQGQEGEMIRFSVPKNGIEVLQGDKIFVETAIPDIQQSFDYELGYEDVISTNKIKSNKLAFAFKLFKNPKFNLERYIYSKDSEPEHTTGITWLLNILGCQCINLTFKGKDGKNNEVLSDGKIELQSVDILGYRDDLGILVIDFTIKLPKEPTKLDNIIGAARFISEKLSISTTPILFCSDYYTNAKASVYDVIIIDRNDIDKLIKLISEDKIDEAKQSLYDITVQSHKLPF
jgi:hypothetical protein